MCGVFGVSYGPGGAAAEELCPTDLAQLMFPAIVHRGPHAFGWMSFNPSDGITVEKYPGLVTDQIDKVQVDDECSWFVGHVRFFTNGTPDNNANNHPIIHGSTVGVHNGVLRGWQSILNETGREDDTAEVDSEAIFAAVDKWGVVKGLRRIDGNMVSVFAQTAHPEVLHLARSYGRPLVYATTPAGSLLFASECCVIDACGLDHNEFTDMEGARYRRLEIVGGKITRREQYRTTEVTLPQSRPRRVPPLSVEQGGTSGITDYFDKGTSRRRGKGRGRSTGTSLDAASARPIGTGAGYVDKHGGTYLGAGWYKTPTGTVMSIADYVEWAVSNEVNRREAEAQRDADDQITGWLADEEQAGRLQ